MRPPFPDEYLTLSTVHKVKGSEFKTVLYLGTGDERFIEHGSFEGEKRQEEVMLMNVACSRAKRNLALFFPISQHEWESGKTRPNPWTIIRNVPSKKYKVMFL